MFRYYADLALALVRDRRKVPADLIARNESGDLSQLIPTQFLADHVIAFYRKDHPRPKELPDFAIIIEIQLDEDERKNRSWPAYVANAPARYDCEIALLVVTDSAATAAWAEGPFGTEQLQLRSAVWFLKEIPQQLLNNDAPYQPLLDVVRAIYQPSEVNTRRVLRVIELLPEEIKMVAFEAVMQVLPSGLRQSLKEEKVNIDPAWFTSDFARHHFALGKEEGRNEAREEILEGLRSSIRDILQLKVSPERAKRTAMLEQIKEPRKLAKIIAELTATKDEAEALAVIDEVISC